MPQHHAPPLQDVVGARRRWKKLAQDMADLRRRSDWALQHGASEPAPDLDLLAAAVLETSELYFALRSEYAAVHGELDLPPAS